MIDYIGDLSRRDAELLRDLAQRSYSILEFGVGASTQIFAAYGRGEVESVDTSVEWIEKTRRNLERLKAHNTVRFIEFTEFAPARYDLIFVDGLNELRLPFALANWDSLAIGGVMCFHDTRRTRPHGKASESDVQMVCRVMELHSTEIDRVVWNQGDSNTTVIHKRHALPLEDYNAIEGRTLRQLGLEP